MCVPLYSNVIVDHDDTFLNQSFSFLRSCEAKAWEISVVAYCSFLYGKPTIGVSLGPTTNITNKYDKPGIFNVVRGKNLSGLK